jgi:D-tyrosyl-tRNA(Tyr) deacylase
MFQYLLVISRQDPVAIALWQQWNPQDRTSLFVGSDPIYQISTVAGAVQRPQLHVSDESLDSLLPAPVREARIPVIFPSIHRSAQRVKCFTVHPLGNAGPETKVGGRPSALVPAPARLMTDALRQMARAESATGMPATYEATHHGPWLRNPAFFAEIGLESIDLPPPMAIQALARLLVTLREEPGDRIAVGVGGGHYAPHFSQLALRRHWAFGHLISRHALPGLDPEVARQAFNGTPGCEGILFARASDASSSAWEGLGPRLRDQDAPRRG